VRLMALRRSSTCDGFFLAFGVSKWTVTMFDLRHSRWIWGCQLSGKGLQQFSGGCRRCGLRRSSSSALFVGVPSRERSRLLAFPPARVLGSGLVRVAGTSLAKGLKITG
jgi:hypothetical protein